MNLCYLYSDSLQYPHRKELLNAFEDSVTLNIDHINTLENYDLYFIELNNVDKEISHKILNIFKGKSFLIYFIIPKNHSLLLFQLASLLESKSIITYTQNIEKIIEKIKIDRKLFLDNNFERWLGNIQIKTQNFIIYKNNKLIFVNKSLLELFGSISNTQFETDILSKIEIQRLIKNDITISADLLDYSNIEERYLFRSVTASDNDKIIYIEKDIHKQNKLEFISSRIAFIELLKENILQRNTSNKVLSLLSINIKNIKSLLSKYGIVEFENILLDILSYMESILKKKLIFSQFESHFYVVLFEDTDFEEIDKIADNFHTKVLNFISNKNYKITLDLFAYHLNEDEFSSIITTLDKIKNEKIVQNESNAQYIKHFTSIKHEITAKNLLDDAFKENSELKILNIYHGLVINTLTKIIKITDENIYISFEPYQGVVLNLEKKTVIKSENFPHDIEAEVKQISLKKKIAILEKFKFLKTDANSREFARVTTPIKIPISIKNNGKIISGTILDISIKSIAINVKHIPNIPIVELKDSLLTFNITDQEAEDGYTQLNLNAKLILVTSVVDEYYKVICDIDQDTHDLSIIQKYVYERQKELIIELKKMSKLH